MQEVQLGQYGIPVLITIFLMVVYNFAGDKIPKRARPLIAIGLGVILSLLAIGYSELDYTFVNIIDYVFYGIMMGASASGLYEGQKALRKQKHPKGGGAI